MAMNYVMYWAGWVLFVLGQAQNSVLSPSNGLEGTAGIRRWFQLHWYTLILRAFLSLIGEQAINHFVISKVEPLLQPFGLELAVWGFAGLSGLAANTLLYMAFGIAGQKFPGLRVEMPALAPPVPDGARPPAVNP